jgi:hypothetical protein
MHLRLILCKAIYSYTGFWICIDLMRIRTRMLLFFKLRIWIHGFDDQKLEKIYS